VDRGAIDPGGIDAGFGKFVAPFLVALIDENLVIHRSGDDFELCAGDVPGRERGVAAGGVCVSRAPTVM
jgi:hypothetical protein